MSFTKGSKPSKNRCKSSEKWRTEVLLFPDSGAGQARCACLAPTAPALSLVPARLGSTLQDRPPPGHRRSRLCAVGPWARSALSARPKHSPPPESTHWTKWKQMPCSSPASDMCHLVRLRLTHGSPRGTRDRVHGGGKQNSATWD